MPKFTLRDASIVVNNVDLSDHASSVELSQEFDEVEFTAFGSVYKEYGVGMGDATATVTFFSDFDAAKVDATLWPLSQSGGTFPLVVKPVKAQATSGSNPTYTMTARLFSYNPIAGDVGDASSGEVTFRNAGTGGLVRGTT